MCQFLRPGAQTGQYSSLEFQMQREAGTESASVWFRCQGGWVTGWWVMRQEPA